MLSVTTAVASAAIARPAAISRTDCELEPIPGPSARLSYLTGISRDRCGRPRRWIASAGLSLAAHAPTAGKQMTIK